jgi:hypothetical protein
MGSMHVVVSSKADMSDVLPRIRARLHAAGIHSSTIQVEEVPEAVVPLMPPGGRYRCLEPLCSHPACLEGDCCYIEAKGKGGGDGKPAGDLLV